MRCKKGINGYEKKNFSHPASAPAYRLHTVVCKIADYTRTPSFCQEDAFARTAGRGGAFGRSSELRWLESSRNFYLISRERSSAFLFLWFQCRIRELELGNIVLYAGHNYEPVVWV